MTVSSTGVHSGTARRTGPGIHEHGLSIVRTTAGASQGGEWVFMDSGFAAAQRPGMTVTWCGASALARLEARIGLVDDVDAPLAPHDAAVLVALLQRLQRIGDLHDRVLGKARNIRSRAPPVNLQGDS